jgi:hypothetical protein
VLLLGSSSVDCYSSCLLPPGLDFPGGDLEMALLGGRTSTLRVADSSTLSSGVSTAVWRFARLIEALAGGCSTRARKRSTCG